MVESIEVLRPPEPHNRWHHTVGLFLLAANSLRHRLRGYRTPRPRRAEALDAAWTYDRAVFANWDRHLEHYLGRALDLRDRHVLELGPGPDLGTGLLWLAAGAASYTAVDAHRLIGPAQRELHHAFAERIAQWSADPALAERLHRAVESVHTPPVQPPRAAESAKTGDDDPIPALRYVVLADFDLCRLEAERFDLVVSHSSFEHLSQPQRSFEQLASRVSPRAHLVAEIDLQTHTRWLREHDPLNIYRYPAPIYRALGFSGIPNRVRPDQYLEMLEHTGWCDLRMYPRRVLEPGYVAAVEPSLRPCYRGDLEHLGWLSLVVCASRPGERSWQGECR